MRGEGGRGGEGNVTVGLYSKCTCRDVYGRTPSVAWATDCLPVIVYMYVHTVLSSIHVTMRNPLENVSSYGFSYPTGNHFLALE